MARLKHFTNISTIKDFFRSFFLVTLACLYFGNIIVTAAPLSGEEQSQINNDNTWSTTKCFTDGGGGSGGDINTAELQSVLKKLAKENNGTTAIAVGQVDDDKATNVNGDTQMATRSTYKVYVAYAILKAVKEGKLSWDSVSTDFNNMIINSDNTAANRLRLKSEVGGPSGITTLLRDKVGLSNKTVIGNGSPTSPAGTNSQSTANDFVKFLKLLENRQLPGLDENADKVQYDRFLGAMKQQSARTNGIKEGVGAGTEVADKPGWGPAPGAATNDIGIVYLPNTYAIAILTDYGNENWAYIKRIASQVNAVMKNKGKDSATPTDGDSILDGHKLPATKGGTGNEDPVDASGRLTTTGESVTFPRHVKHGQAYQDYYITMRWDYAMWSWDGGASAIDNAKYNWFSNKPRKVLVTNPRTKKSIIAVAAEAGPAPYAGAKGSQSENGYATSQRYTPDGYTGRVAGLPPVARDAIGAQQTENGEGDKLLYAWAPDQSATPGPTDDTASDNSGVGGGCVCPDSTTNVKAGVETKTMKDFIKNYGQATFDIGKKYGIPYDAILAQAGLESGWGARTPPDSNNLFGIKAYPGWNGPVVSAGTQEDDGSGNLSSTTASFIKFNSIEEGIEGYAQFIHRNERYKTALKYPTNPVRYIQEIKKAGYATDISYVTKVVGVLKTAQKYIKDNNLFPPSSEVTPDGAPPSEAAGGAGGSSENCGNSGGNGDAVATAIKYAWPEYHAPPYLKMKPEYREAVLKASQEGKYVGGGINPGIDCGGFVTRAMQDSGADPNYGGGGNTLYQERYMKEHPEKYEPINPGSDADLHPGDIAINDVHTYMFVGKQPGFGEPIASASYSESGFSWRTPMAGKEKPADSNYRWYRLK